MLLSAGLLMLLQLLVCTGQPFSDYYGGKSVKGATGSSMNFKWTILRPFTRVEWGLAASSSAFDVPPRLLVSFFKGSAFPVTPPAAYTGRVSGNINGSQVSFTLRNLRKSDGRLYGCRISDTDNGDDRPSFDSVMLVVEGPPTITYVSNNQTANEGDVVMLNCSADGKPPPNITWTRLSSNSPVTFPLVVRRHDEGGYRCSADNGIAIKIIDVFITVQYAATVKTVTPVTSQSWIGQTVKLTCTAQGAPTPVLSWKNPSGKVLKQVTELNNIVDVQMTSDQDFGNYTCEATNVVNTDTSTVQVQQIKAPGSPTFTVDIEATSITVNWTKPADDGGSPITAYRVLILRGNTEIENRNITDLTAMQLVTGGLTKSTNYTIKLFARNYVFEGNAAERKIQTKYEGVPGAAEITDLPAETKNVSITLKWKEAENNGSPITQYTVYRRTIREDGTSLNWIKIKEITDTSDRKVVVNVEKGKEYELVVTATNKFGEGGKEERKIRKIKVLGGAPSAVAFIYELNADEITLKWEEPNDNGAEITMYTVYYGTLNDEQWKETKKITDVSVRKYVEKVVMGKKYKVLVTASNKYGESSKEGKIQLVDVLEGFFKPTGSQTAGFSKPTGSQTAGSSCDNQKETLHAVYITIICLLLISNLILIFFVCRMRTLSGNVRGEKNCPRCGDLLAMNPIAVKVEADTQSFDVERTFEAPSFSTTANADYMPLHPSTRNWEISRRQVNIITVIGKGAFSQVAKATVKNLRGSQDNLTVAVKMLKGVV